VDISYPAFAYWGHAYFELAYFYIAIVDHVYFNTNVSLLPEIFHNTSTPLKTFVFTHQSNHSHEI
jgi:hypothetical protein